jgi:hypothetical protein
MTENLTLKQGYLAMYAYLDALQRRTNSDDLAGFLSSMSILRDGTTADPAAWNDWLEAVKKITEENDENYGLLTVPFLK